MTAPANAARTATIPLQALESTPIAWGAKDPGSSLPYSVNMKAFLADMGATIVGTPIVTGITTIGPDSGAPTLTASAVTVTDPTGIITVNLSGGTISTTNINCYFVGFSVPLSQGGPLTFGVWLPVMELFAAPSIPNAIVTVGPQGVPGAVGPAGASGTSTPATPSALGGVLTTSAVASQGGTATLGLLGTHDTTSGVDLTSGSVVVNGGSAVALGAELASILAVASGGGSGASSALAVANAASAGVASNTSAIVSQGGLISANTSAIAAESARAESAEAVLFGGVSSALTAAGQASSAASGAQTTANTASSTASSALTVASAAVVANGGTLTNGTMSAGTLAGTDTTNATFGCTGAITKVNILTIRPNVYELDMFFNPATDTAGDYSKACNRAIIEANGDFAPSGVQANGKPVKLVLPHGYRLLGTQLGQPNTEISCPLFIEGQGIGASQIGLALGAPYSSYGGGVFTWSWPFTAGNDFPVKTTPITNPRSRFGARGFSVYGNLNNGVTTGMAQQDLFSTTQYVRFGRFKEVECFNLPGRPINLGFNSSHYNFSSVQFHEIEIDDIRANSSGDSLFQGTGNPGTCIAFGGYGSGSQSDDLRLGRVRVYGCMGDGIAFIPQAGANLQTILGAMIQVEAYQSGNGGGTWPFIGWMFRFGNSNSTGKIQSMNLENLRAINCYTGYGAYIFDGPAGGAGGYNPTGLRIAGGGIVTRVNNTVGVRINQSKGIEVDFQQWDQATDGSLDVSLGAAVEAVAINRHGLPVQIGADAGFSGTIAYLGEAETVTNPAQAPTAYTPNYAGILSNGTISATPGFTYYGGSSGGTIYLPTLATAQPGGLYTIADLGGQTGTHPLTLTTTDGAAINGAASITTAYGGVVIQNNGTIWSVISNSAGPLPSAAGILANGTIHSSPGLSFYSGTAGGTIYLPTLASAPAGGMYTLVDGAGFAKAYPAALATTDGSTINGNGTLAANYGALVITNNGTVWNVVNNTSEISAATGTLATLNVGTIQSTNTAALGYLSLNGTSAATVSTTIPYSSLTGTPSLGSIASQSASSVNLTGGTIGGVTFNANSTIGSAVTVTNSGTISGGNIAGTITNSGSIVHGFINADTLQVGGVAVSTGSGAVSSVFGRTGAVVAATGDYTAAQVTNAATSGANTNITSLGGLTTPLSPAQGGTGAVAPAWALNGGWVANRWYAAPNGANFSGAAVGVALRPYATPVFVPNSVTVKKIAFNITTLDTSAWNARMMVFSDSSGAPGTAVIDSGTQAISASASGIQSLTLGSTVNLTVGWYWFVFIADTTAVSVSSILASSPAEVGSLLGGNTAGAVLSATAAATGVYGTALAAIGSTFTSFGSITYANGLATPQIAVGL